MARKTGKDLVTIETLPKKEIEHLLEMTAEFEAHPNRNILNGKVVATLFFEPSTRTRLSFERRLCDSVQRLWDSTTPRLHPPRKAKRSTTQYK